MSTFEGTEIVPHLWIGGIRTAHNKEWVESHVDIVINCTKDLMFISQQTENIRLPVDDNLELSEIAKLYTFLEKTSTYIDYQLRKGKRILVHCMAGRQRSASVLCAFLMTFLELPFQKVASFLQTKRPVIFSPQCNFQPALLRYEVFLKNKKKTIDE